MFDEDGSSPASDSSPAAAATSARVVDASGEPVPEAEAVVLRGSYEPLRGTASEPLHADDEGRIALSLTDDELEDALLIVWAPGHASLRRTIDGRGDDLEVRLPAPTALHGRIDAVGDRIDHVWLDTTRSEAAWPFFVRCDVDDDGRFHVLGLEAGTYRVSSRPLGGAPVLSADREGRVRFLAEDPGQVPVLGHRFVDREIVADGREHAVRAAFGRVVVVGRVQDESGAPIAGAQVRLSSEERPSPIASQTDAQGRFEAAVPPTPNLRVVASHPDYGHQWSALGWEGWSRYDAIPETPIRLVLRRGVVVRGQLVDESGAPRPDFPLLMIPPYMGSGPATIEVRTDAEGRFAFERAVLDGFELVPRSLDEWHPEGRGRAGEHLRIVDEHESWVERASAGQPLELRLESYTLVPVELRIVDANQAPLRNREVELWLRTSPDVFLGQVPRTDGEGRTRALMERGLRYEVWATPLTPGQPREAPWTRGIPPLWTGAVDQARELTLTVPGRP